MSQEKRSPNERETMAGNLKEKPGDAASFDDNQYASEEQPVAAGPTGSAGGANVSKQGGGSGSSKQGGNTGSTPDASG